MKQKTKNAQVAVETLFSVIIVLGLLVVISFLGLQQSEQTNALKAQQEKAIVCQQLAGALERAFTASEQINVRFLLLTDVWIAKNSIGFSSDQNDFVCYFNADMNNATNAVPLRLAPGEYSIQRNSLPKVVVVPYCTPQRCGNAGFQCGVKSDSCGGSIFCGDCPSGETCSDGTCNSGGGLS